ncbi:MAG: hypothetical protein EP329_10010 [Deltaproteobacteria bacterium]|nr:MAG: hypothetical protein EP329_10010 [Deltaproteobacteria bacterium]
MKPAHVTVVTSLLLVAAVNGPAHAANDALCGATLTESLTLTADIDCTGYTGTALTIGADGVVIDGNGHRLLAPDAAYAIFSSAFDDLTVRNLDVAGWCGGVGVYFVNGTGLTLENVHADGRTTGFSISGATDVTLRHLTADSAKTYGLALTSVTLPLQIEDVRLTNAGTGLYLATITGPLTLDAIAFPDLRGDDTSINLAANVHDVTFDGLVLDGAAYGVTASSVTNSGLVFRDVDVSGTSGAGYGLYLGGSQQRLERVTADRRAYGVYTTGVSDLALDDVRAAGATNDGIYLANTVAPLTLRKISVPNCDYGLYISGYEAPIGSPLVIDSYVPATELGVLADTSGCDAPLLLINVQHASVGDPPTAPPLRLDGATYGIHAYSTTNADLTFRHLDLSGRDGTGTGLYLAGSQLTVEDVATDRRSIGYDIRLAADVTLRDVRADNCATTGLSLTTITPPLVLEQLALANNSRGLLINGLASPVGAPLDLGPWVDGVGGAIAAIGGADVSVALSNVQNVLVHDLVLDGRSNGLDAYVASNTGIRVVDVDVSGYHAGRGVILAGSGHELTRVTADNRANGIYLVTASDVAITDLTARRCAEALKFLAYTTAQTPPTLSGLTLTDNSTALTYDTVNAPWTLDGAAAGLNVSGSRTGLAITKSSQLTFQNASFPAEGVTGISVGATNSALTFDTVDVSGHGAGSGMLIASGADFTLTDVTANHRSIGVRATGTSNLVVTNLVARHNASYGLLLEQSSAASGHIAPTLSGLDLRDNDVALYLGGWSLPITLDGATSLGLDTTGSATGVALAGASDVTLAHLTLDNVAFGVDVRTRSDRLTIAHVDVSAHGRGTGLRLGVSTSGTSRAGVDLVLTDVTANRRLTGVATIGADNLLIDGLTATGNKTAGLSITDSTADAGLVLRDLTLSDNGTGLSLTTVSGTAVNPVVIDPFDGTSGAITDLSGCDTGIYVVGSSGLTFTGLAIDGVDYGINAAGGATDLTFSGVDVSGAVGLGDGIHLNGGTHTLVDVTANRRANGVYATAVTDLAITHLSADLCGIGLAISSVTLPLTLSDVSATRCTTGVSLRTFAGPFNVGPTAITSLAGSDTGLYLYGTSDLRVHDLDLAGQNRSFAVNAATTVATTLEHLDVSGTGQGVGINLTGADHVVRDVDAHQRATGVAANAVTNVTLDTIRARGARSYGISLTSATLPATLAALTLEDDATGLYLTGGAGGPLTLGPTHVASLAGTGTAIYDSSSAFIVDDAGLGLVAAGASHYTTPVRTSGSPGPDPDCGAPLDGVTPPLGAALTLNAATKTYTLVADLDCSLTIDPALDVVADDVVVDGAGFAVFAPFATAAVRVFGRANVTVRDLDVSASYGAGVGVLVDGGTNVNLVDVIANDRYRGVDAKNLSELTVTGLVADRSSFAGLDLTNVSLPLTLGGLSLTRGAGSGLRFTGFDGDPLVTGARFVVDAAAVTDLTGNDVAIGLAGTVTALTLTGAAGAPLVLDGAEHGVLGASATLDHVDLRYLDVSGPRIGKGVEIGGAAVTVADLTARDRSTGIETGPSASDLTLSDLTVSGAWSRAVYLNHVTPPVALTGLTLTDSNVALDVNDLVGVPGTPTVIDTASLADVGGSLVGVKLTAASDVTVAGYPPADRLLLTNVDGGVVATSALNHDLVFTGLDVSGRSGDAKGLWAYGDDITVDDVIADRRATGIHVQTGANPTVTGLQVSDASAEALSLGTLTGTFTLSGLALTNSTIGLKIDALSPTTRLVIDGTTVTSFAGNATCISVSASSNLGFADLTLPCDDYGVSAYSATNSDLRFERLDASGSRHEGYGIRTWGADTVLVDVIANDRAYGVDITSAPGLVIDGLVIDGATNGTTSGVGLSITTVPAPLTLTGLSLTNNGTDLKLNGVSGTDVAPLVLGPTQITAIGGDSGTNVALTNVQYVTVSGLTLDGWTYAVDGRSASNAHVVIAGCDLSGMVVQGLGAHLYGQDIAVTGCVSNDRAYGVDFQSVDGFTLTDFSAARNTTGVYVYLYPATQAAPTFAGLHLHDNATALQLAGFTHPYVFDGDPGLASPLGLDLAGNQNDIVVSSGSSGLTFKNLALHGWGAGFKSDNALNSDLTLDTVDLSGSRLGDGAYLKGSNLTVSNVTVDGRRYALDVYSVSGFDLSDVSLTNSYVGLFLHGFGAPLVAPTLSGLTLSGLSYAIAMRDTPGPLVLDGQAQGITIADSNIGLWCYPPVSNVTFQHFDLRGARNEAITFYNGAVSGCVIDDVDASGPMRGKGVSLSGPGHTVTNVTANDRDYGVWGSAGLTGLTLSAVEARRANTAGVYLSGATAPTLSGLDVAGSTIGLQLASVTGPETVDASVLSATGARTALLVAGSQDLTFSDLVLPNNVAVSAGDRYNRDLTFERLDVTGSCLGYGLAIGGEGALVDHVVAGRRDKAIWAYVGDDLVIRNSVMGASATGLDASSASLRLDSEVADVATNTTAYLRLLQSTTSVNLDLGETVRVSLPGGDEDVTVIAKSSYYITVSPALTQVPPAGTPVRALDAGGDRVLVESSDICANTTGLLAAAQQTHAVGNYWRSSTGPTHASNPGGTGDLVNATNTAFVPFVLVPSDKDNDYCNQAPVADAGAPQTVCEGDVVTLDASASSDPDVEPLTYAWTQLAGTAATLTNADTATPTFVAPTPASPPETLTFEVTVADDVLERAATVEVAVELGNPLPTAVAGTDQTVDEGAPVTLSAAGSFDPDGTALTYVWVQTAGPSATLTGADTASPSFTAPAVGPGGGPLSATLTFVLTVTDQLPAGYCGGPKSAADSVDVVVNNIDNAPSAAAGADQTVDEGTLVTLDASGSSDPDGDTLSYAWVQTGGTSVTLSGASTAAPTFTAPEQPDLGSEVLTFSVTVSDGFGGVASDSVSVTVEDVCPDTDGDGVVDCLETCDTDPLKLEPGLCGCGVPDDDSDGDGTPDCVDGCPADPNKTDPGVCGCGALDTDSNNNGTPDCAEDCGGQPDGTVVAAGVPCGSGACGDITADITCEGGVAVSGCDAAIAQIPDDTCPPDAPVVAYAIVYDAAGAAVGTIRCSHEPSTGAIACDESAPGTLTVYPGLFCPGVSP